MMSNVVLSLYRRLLRLQYKLPPDFRQLGVSYVRDEFKRVKDIKDEQIYQMFVTEWQTFAITLEEQLQAGQKFGSKLDKKEMNLLSDEQVFQLSEIYYETKKPPP